MKQRLIKLLGGYTHEEALKLMHDTESRTEKQTLQRISQYMRDINGLSAEEWCDAVWTYVINEQKKLC